MRQRYKAPHEQALQMTPYDIRLQGSYTYIQRLCMQHVACFSLAHSRSHSAPFCCAPVMKSWNATRGRSSSACASIVQSCLCSGWEFGHIRGAHAHANLGRFMRCAFPRSMLTPGQRILLQLVNLEGQQPVSGCSKNVLQGRGLW